MQRDFTVKLCLCEIRGGKAHKMIIQYHGDEEMHPLLQNFSPLQTIPKNLDVKIKRRVYIANLGADL